MRIFTAIAHIPRNTLTFTQNLTYNLLSSLYQKLPKSTYVTECQDNSDGSNDRRSAQEIGASIVIAMIASTILAYSSYMSVLSLLLTNALATGATSLFLSKIVSVFESYTDSQGTTHSRGHMHNAVGDWLARIGVLSQSFMVGFVKGELAGTAAEKAAAWLNIFKKQQDAKTWGIVAGASYGTFLVFENYRRLFNKYEKVLPETIYYNNIYGVTKYAPTALKTSFALAAGTAVFAGVVAGLVLGVPTGGIGAAAAIPVALAAGGGSAAGLYWLISQLRPSKSHYDPNIREGSGQDAIDNEKMVAYQNIQVEMLSTLLERFKQGERCLSVGVVEIPQSGDELIKQFEKVKKLAFILKGHGGNHSIIIDQHALPADLFAKLRALVRDRAVGVIKGEAKTALGLDTTQKQERQAVDSAQEVVDKLKAINRRKAENPNAAVERVTITHTHSSLNLFKMHQRERKNQYSVTFGEGEPITLPFKLLPPEVAGGLLEQCHIYDPMDGMSRNIACFPDIFGDIMETYPKRPAEKHTNPFGAVGRLLRTHREEVQEVAHPVERVVPRRNRFREAMTEMRGWAERMVPWQARMVMAPLPVPEAIEMHPVPMAPAPAVPPTAKRHGLWCQLIHRHRETENVLDGVH